MEIRKSKWLGKDFKKNIVYYIMFIPCVIFLVMFSYIPMFGIVLAFKDYYPRLGIWGSPFAESIFTHFELVFNDYYFWVVFKNTIVISLLRIAVGFPVTVIMALLFNELRSPKYAKVVQTVLFIPYFLSWIVMAGMIKRIFGNDGMINGIIMGFGGERVNYLTDSSKFLPLIILTDVWKTAGYGMIIYLASISTIEQSLYEAIEIDGGNRFHKMIAVTLPGIKSTLAIQLILSVSGVLNGGFDQIFNLYSVPVYDVADIIDTYIYRLGIDAGQIELGTALGLFKSVIAFVLIVVVNKVSKKIGGEGIW